MEVNLPVFAGHGSPLPSPDQQKNPVSLAVMIENCGPGGGLARGVKIDPRPTPPPPNPTPSTTTTTKPDRHPTTTKIAIVGQAVNLPNAPTVDALWELLVSGGGGISEIPPIRFTFSTTTNTTANLIPTASEFDHKFFNISPREARSMDPQQRLLLQTAWAAIESAGWVGDRTGNADRFGCYVGAATEDYVQNLKNEIDVYYSTGTLRAFLSGRISYALKLGGPSVVVDTACSSSSVAVYQACRALVNGDCDAALAGGVNVIASPQMQEGLHRAHFLSRSSGQCMSFAGEADGYARAEGCGMVVLKRLEDAVRDGDGVLGVVSCVEVNQSGRASSITHPCAGAQRALFERVLERSGVGRERVGVVEAHGTGTQAGDPTEVASIRSVFAHPSRPLHITSIKANIGHLEAASGVAGLAKILLMFKHNIIPAQISLRGGRHLNPKIQPLDVDGCVISTENVPWERRTEDEPRMALLNNFGAAGSNVAILLEEYLVPTPSEPRTHHHHHYVFGVSAKTRTALRELIAGYVGWVSSPVRGEGLDLGDVAYTMTARRRVYQLRVAVCAGDRKELVRKLEEELRRLEGEGDDGGVVTSRKPGGVVFVFSGQGSQYLGMGRELYQTSVLFKSHVDACDSFLVSSGFPSILGIIQPNDGASGLSTREEFQAFQSCTLAIQHSLAMLWMSWGVKPDAAVGHSLGEYAALVIANVLTLETALTLVATRARLIEKRCVMNSSGMMAVGVGAKGAMRLVDEAGVAKGTITLAVVNSPTDCVLAGPLNVLGAFKNHLDGLDIPSKIKNTLLNIPFAFHSTAMEPIADELTSAARRLENTIRKPTIPIVSNVLGKVVLPQDDENVFNAEYFARHSTETVLFDSGVRALVELSPFETWIEIGPHPITLPMLKSNLPAASHTELLPSLRKQHQDWASLTGSLARLYISGSTRVDWSAVYRDDPRVTCMVDMPTYPFAKTKFWAPYVRDTPVKDVLPAAIMPPDAYIPMPLLDRCIQLPAAANAFTAIFETSIHHLAALITGHKVGGIPLCPASVYIEMALEGIAFVRAHLGSSSATTHSVLRDLHFVQPLVYDAESSLTIFTTLCLTGDRGTFSVSSRSGSEPVVYVNGDFKTITTKASNLKLARALPLTQRRIEEVTAQHPQPCEVFSSRTMYDIIFPRVVDYGEQYRTVKSISIQHGSKEAVAHVAIPVPQNAHNYIVSPIFTDTLLHVAGFVANMQTDAADVFICTHAGTVDVAPENADGPQMYTIYCVLSWIPDEGIMLAESFAVHSDHGRLVAHFKGMQFRRVKKDGFSRGLERAGKLHRRYESEEPSISQPTLSSSCVSTPASGFFADSSPESSSTLFDPSHIQTMVSRVVSTACGTDLKAASVDAELTSLGVDSLMSIEITAALREVFPSCELSAGISGCYSVGDVVRVVIEGSSHLVSPSSSKSDSRYLSTSVDLDFASGLQSCSTPFYPPATSLSPLKTHSALLEQKLISAASNFTSDPPGVETDDLDLSTLRRLLASILEIDERELHQDLDFANLGVDSLLAIEAVGALNRRNVGKMAPLPSNLFDTCKTLRALHTFLLHQGHSDGPVHATPQLPLLSPFHSQNSPVTRLQSSVPSDRQHSRPLPLFLIHDGSGMVNYYEQLQSLDRSVWTISNPRLFASPGDSQWASVVEMAGAYASYICDTLRRNMQSGPVLLGGWSFGGIIAYETALCLRRLGITVHGVVMIDTPPPMDHVPLSADMISCVLQESMEIQSSPGQARTSARGISTIHQQFSVNTRLLSVYIPTVATYQEQPKIVYLRSREGYVPKNPDVVVPKWLADRPSSVATGWERLVTYNGILVLDVPGNHFQPFQPQNILEVSRCISKACTYLDAA